MLDFFSEVRRLTECDAVHVRSGQRESDISDDKLINFLYREVAELDAGREAHRRAEADGIFEAADVLAVLFRYAVRRGWTPEALERAGIEKLRLRFAVAQESLAEATSSDSGAETHETHARPAHGW